MATLLLDRTTGLERIARETTLIINTGINAEIEQIEAAWSALDYEYAALMGLALEGVTLERVATSSIYLGHRPSLINAPLSQYPVIAVMAYHMALGGEIQMDTFDGVDCTMHIDLMVKSGPYGENDLSGDGEDLVNRRCQRTADAIVNLMQKNRTINGLVDRISNPPDVDVFEVFVRREENGRGPRWFWQGASIEYHVTRLAQAY